MAQELVAHLAVTQDAEQLEAAPRIAVRAMHVALRLRQLGATALDHVEVRGVPIRERRVTHLAVKVLTHGRRREDEQLRPLVLEVRIGHLEHCRRLAAPRSVDDEHARAATEDLGPAQVRYRLLVRLEPRLGQLMRHPARRL